MNYAILETAMGPFGFVGESQRLVASYLPRPKAVLLRSIVRDWPGATEDSNLLSEFRREVRDYFAGKPVRFSVAVDLTRHPPFFRAVYEACRKIPYGKTASYLDLARAAGSPKAARAVGQAMARNPMPLVIPCHRVLAADGSIGGFSAPRGLKLKAALLQLERSARPVRRDVA